MDTKLSDILPAEIIRESAMYIPYEQIIHLCAMGWTGEYKLCEDKEFWRERLEYEIGLP